MVNASTTMPTASAEEAAWGIVKGRSTKSLKFADPHPQIPGEYQDRPVGTSYTGVLVENLVAQQARDYDSQQPKFYDDGNPIMELVMVLNVPSDLDPTDEDDDGNRVLRLNAGGKRALQEECRRLGIERFGVGTTVTITFTGYKPNQKGRASKLFDIKLDNVQPWRSAEQLKVEQAMQQGAPQQPAAVPQQPVAVPQQPVAVPQQPVAVPQAPAVDPALLAAAQAAQQAGAPSAGIVVLEQHIAQVRALLGSNIPREVALQAVANTAAGGDATFRDALDAAEQNAPF